MNPKYLRYIESVTNNRSRWVEEACERRIADEEPVLMNKIINGRKAEEELGNVCKNGSKNS